MAFMDNLSKIAKTVGDGAKVAAKKSGDMVEVAKINMAINTEEDKIRNLYMEMGKIVFDTFERTNVVDEAYVDNCNKVTEIKRNIADMKQKIVDIKNSKACSACGEEMGMDVMFCPKCGAKQD